MGRLISKFEKIKEGFSSRSNSDIAWLKALFPHTAAPDEFENRLQRLEVAPFELGGQSGGVVTCRFIYPEIDGSIESGVVKFFIPPALNGRRGVLAPLVHMAGYEIEAIEAAPYLKEGMIVSTVHNHPLNVMSRGPKLEWALMHAMRRLPFVDDARVYVKGICTGGNMALLAAVETFPLVCAMATVPPVNLAYNLPYLHQSLSMANSCRAGSEKPWLPIVASMQALLAQAADRFGDDYEAPAYHDLSPVSLVEWITCPVLTCFSTGDLNVPLDQVAAELVKPFDVSDYPPGFTREMTAIVKHPERRKRLFDVIPQDRRDVFTVSVPEGARKKRMGGDDFTGSPVEMPFSRTRQWTIAVVDEGPPEPRLSHFKHAIAPDFTEFRRWADAEVPHKEQLTAKKLQLMMKRYLGQEPLQIKVSPTKGGDYLCRLLDFPRAEHADVLRGLMTFSRNNPAALRLTEVYEGLPDELKGLGKTLGDGSAESVRRTLAHLQKKIPYKA